MPSSVLGFVTTVHLALAALRNHRSAVHAPISALAAISLLFSAMPWLFPSLPGIAVGLALHLAWFFVCERLTPPVAARRRIAPVARELPSQARPAAAVQRPQGFVQVPVLAVLDEARDIKTIRLARPAGFEFVAGQFLAVRVRVDGKDCSRCYSISSAPDVPGYLEISVKRQGLVSSALHVTSRPGSALSVRAPSGAFKYPAGDDRPLVLLAGGVGITPLMSMLRHAVHAEPSRPVTLFYSARTEAEFAFRDELAAIARRHPQVRVQLASSGAESADVYPGRLDTELIRAVAPHVRDSVCLICGPGPMIDGMKGVLGALGVPPAQIRFEVFEAAIAASAAREDAPAAPPAGGRAGHHHSVRCERSGQTMPIAAGQTLLEAAEAAGVALDSMCRAGICGTCRTRVTEGDMACDTEALSEAERAGGFVLACVATARSNCTVEL